VAAVLAIVVAALITAVLVVVVGGRSVPVQPVQPTTPRGITAQTSQIEVRALVTKSWRHVPSPLKGFDCYTQEAPFASTRSGRAWVTEVCLQNTGPAVPAA
jgi:hypothetical protein